jgi:hypothetical protein
MALLITLYEGAHEDVYYPHYHPGEQHPKLDEREGRPRSKAGTGTCVFWRTGARTPGC